MIKISALLLAALAGISLLAPLSASAQLEINWGQNLLSCTGDLRPNAPSTLPKCTSFCDILKTIQNILNFIMTMTVFVISPALVIWGGFKLMTSAGNPAALGDAKKIVTGVVIGIALTLGSYLILNTFLWLIARGTLSGSGAPVEGLGWPTIACDPTKVPGGGWIRPYPTE